MVGCLQYLALLIEHHDPCTYRNLADSNLGIVLLGLQLELNIQAKDLRVDEHLGLLLETGVRERLLESNALDQKGVLKR